MTTHHSLDEDRFFAEVDADLVRQLRVEMAASARTLAERRKTAEAAQTGDVDLADCIAGLGFRGHCAKVFDLVPLVLVAWADGKVTRSERAIIGKVLAARGIPPESDSYARIVSLLDEEPDPEWRSQALAILKRLLGEDAVRAHTLVDLCTEVAKASGGILGLRGDPKPTEVQALQEISKALGLEGDAPLRSA